MNTPTPLTARYRILAVGRAGAAAVHPLLSAGLTDVDFAVLDTDPESLALSPIPHQVHFGEAATYGLGTGSDPARGRAAAESDLDRLRPLVSGARLVFIVAGLGGGTGSGATPVLARLAREAGALTLGVAALPFDCEGRQRTVHAREALNAFRSAADAVICVPKQRVLSQFKEQDRPALTEVLKAANELSARSINGLIQLLTRPGLMPLDFAHLERLLRGRHAESCFATVEAAGPQRTREAIDQILRHPFLDRGQALAQADAVLLSLAAGPEITFTEIDHVFTHLQNVCEHATVITGTSIDTALTGRLVVTVIASRSQEAPQSDSGQGSEASAVRHAAPPLPGTRPDTTAALGSDLLAAPPIPGVPGAFTAVPPRNSTAAPDLSPQEAVTVAAGAPSMAGARKKIKPVQSLLNFDLLPNRGRFEGLPATVYQGEDLDIPTYVRRGISFN